MNNGNLDEFLNNFFYLMSFNHWFLNNHLDWFDNFLIDWDFFQHLYLDWWLSYHISNFHYFLNNLWNLDYSVFNFDDRNNFFDDAVNRFIFCDNLMFYFRCFVVYRFLNNYFFYFLNFDNFWNLFHNFLNSINDNFDRFENLHYFLSRNYFFLLNDDFMILRHPHNNLFLNLNNLLNFHNFFHNPINIL